MNRVLLFAPMLLLVSPPAFSQNAPGGDGRDSSYARMDRDLDDIVRSLGEAGRGGLRRGGAAFYMRNGDAVVAVRCDPQDSMRACVDSTLTLLERARSAQPSGAAPSGGAGGQPQSR
jgi:hypothetical protein